jgi:hypothetical protein
VILGEPDDRARGLDRRILLQLAQRRGERLIARPIDAEDDDSASGEVPA